MADSDESVYFDPPARVSHRVALVWAGLTLAAWAVSFALAMVASSSASPHRHGCVTQAPALTEISISGLLLLAAGISSIAGLVVDRPRRRWFGILLALCVVGFLGWFVVELQTGFSYCPDRS